MLWSLTTAIAVFLSPAFAPEGKTGFLTPMEVEAEAKGALAGALTHLNNSDLGLKQMLGAQVALEEKLRRLGTSEEVKQSRSSA
jgi:hypothetical protein